MDPLWATVAEFWWIGPSVIGAGAAGWFGLRQERTARLRRIELDAARGELKAARRDAASARVAVRVARTELARVQAERATGRASNSDTAAARKNLERTQREAKAAAATVRVRRAHVDAARTALPAAATDPAALPLARLMAAHDEITARWMAYETDPARLIAFPAMTDAREPLTAHFLAAQRAARELRPASPQARITATQFTAYRDAVLRETRAFEAAEADAWRRARAAGDMPSTPREGDPDAAAPSALSQWSTAAQDFAQGLAQTVIARSADAIARAAAARVAAGSRPASPPPADAGAAPPDPTAPGDARPTPPRDTRPPWPIPSRTRSTPRP